MFGLILVYEEGFGWDFQVVEGVDKNTFYKDYSYPQGIYHTYDAAMAAGFEILDKREGDIC